MDIVDKTQEREEKMESLIKQQQQKKSITTPSKSHCQECQKPIPKARQLAIAGVRFCVVCQTNMELGVKPKRGTYASQR